MSSWNQKEHSALRGNNWEALISCLARLIWILRRPQPRRRKKSKTPMKVSFALRMITIVTQLFCKRILSKSRRRFIIWPDRWSLLSPLRWPYRKEPLHTQVSKAAPAECLSFKWVADEERCKESPATVGNNKLRNVSVRRRGLLSAPSCLERVWY